MNDEDLEFIKQKYKWLFLWTDIFDRYFILIAPLFFIFLAFIIIYFSLIRTTNFSFLLVTIPIFLFGYLTFCFMFKRIESKRKFRIIPFEKQNIGLENNFNSLGWRLFSKTEKVIVGEGLQKILPFLGARLLQLFWTMENYYLTQDHKGANHLHLIEIK